MMRPPWKSFIEPAHTDVQFLREFDFLSFVVTYSGKKNCPDRCSVRAATHCRFISKDGGEKKKMYQRKSGKRDLEDEEREKKRMREGRMVA